MRTRAAGRSFVTIGAAVLCAALAGCATVHTGVLGDISAGLQPAGVLKTGDTYNDPDGRFSLAVNGARSLVARRTKEGVVFKGKAADRGEVVYAVFVYEIPGTMQGDDQQILRSVWAGLVEKAAWAHGSLVAVSMEENACFGLICLDVCYRSDRGRHHLRRGYISRLIKNGSRVYHLYYSYASRYQRALDPAVYNTPEAFEALREPADQFFAGVRLK